MSKREKRERGAALIIVLGLVALVGAWASSAAFEDMVSLRRAENMQDAIRAQQGSRSALALAVKALRQDAARTSIDEPGELWASPAPPFTIDQGSVALVITDANRRLNLNDLVNDQGKLQMDVYGRLRRLFVRTGLDAGLVEALADWMDADDRPVGASGGEDSSYIDKPYRVKNGRLDRWSELAMIHGFTRDVMNKLATVVVVRPVPQGDMTPINLNTADVNVLRAVFPSMKPADADALIAGRPYQSTSEALANRSWSTGVNPADLSVTSDLFIVRTDARFGRAQLREEYMLMRQANMLTLLSRERLSWGDM
ncbi:type II secretion system minor pseudopilin GspK [Mariprofundus erugo]|uniref:type II secretion system minor pseudopilin GspK n=1 Tax=Mariprofundus erugo TaxID=2528639 RepID=UPI001930F7A8|nr:type II secretion system minor pseudopilin GspK [Mariprofundus erugo]